ncbi:MAG TPA: FAD-dependent thymidylate synthase [Candidatus Methylomirabilis sp.]|nr:FAD-dependent thymidylate synthase [Candidatus Methylomirabilis sp.]
MAEVFTPEEVAVLSPYVTNVDRPIFALTNLPEEVVAVLFAYYSRSRESLRRNLLKLIQEKDLDITERLNWARSEPDDLALARQKAKEFHEKWVVGYGHASVAEHAVAHLAVEDVSILASKIIEDTRLASYTEKSTRYVVFDREKFYREPRVTASRHARIYEETCGFLLDTYTHLTDPVLEAVRRETPREEKQTERGYAAACRAKTCDILRYVLPAATLTNIGMTLNGRLLEHLITKLLSHPLEESRQIGARLKAEGQKIIPTLIKYADHSAYLAETNHAMETLAGERFAGLVPEDSPDVSLVRYPEDAEDQLVAAILYGYVAHPWRQVEEQVQKLSQEEKARVIDEYLFRRGRHDQPLRALEHLTYSFDILVDFGAFRDIQRHRMCTQTPQELGPLHGFSTPPEIERYGLLREYEECMARAQSAFDEIARDFPREAAYVLPLAFRKRVLFTWNLREIHHFVQLRSAKQGHASYRRIARQVFKQVERVHPHLAKYIRVDLEDHALARL